ncbi:hypothetical protein QJQ45_006751 [Haematococcus lacustris]|nr:hypothetical protein QJQ45_006751 [Haematococcus lacustris]
MLSQCSLADPSSLMQGSPLWACMASPVISGGAEGSSGHTSACYLGVPEGKPSAASATSGCSHTPSVAEDQPGVEIRGPPLAPRSKPGRGMDRQQLPTRTPKHQPLGLGAARRRDRKQRAKAPTPLLERWSTAGKGLLDAMRKGCTLRNACAFLLILCALLPTMHACPPQQPQEAPALPCLFSCVTIAHTLPDGHQHLPPDARFTKHPKGMLFGHHPDMTAAQHHQLQAVIEAHDNAFSYSLSDLPGYHVGCTASPAGLAAAVVAAAEEDTDVHADIATLHFLRTGAHNPGQSATELRRVTRRAKAYRWDSNQLLRVMADGSTKVVPAPPARDQLVLAMHGSNGHFGVRRTTAILLHNHWWAGIHADVARVLRSCHVCDRARASFNLRAAQLSPLPVQGLFYRWGVDLAGPLPRTHRGHEYLMVCIEHLTKHVELVPIPDRLASTTAYHFHHQVLGRFGASAEVLTDGGREFQGEFADLLQRHLIDHRVTSPHHPQADGLAERAVQTFKDALRKHIAVSGDPAAWDEALPAIALGYRVSPQEATKCSPYSLLYGRAPVLPPAVVQRMARPVNLDDPVVAAHDLLERSAVLSRETAAAMGNIRIAQHRDTLRYATTHSGSYKPAVRQLHPGSFVWTQRPQSNTLQLSARPEIYRVVSVGVNGVAKLQGKCGRVMAENVCNLAPCHLPDIDPTIDHTLARPTADFPCSICKSPTDAERMLLCDGCGKGFHTFCLTPKLTAVPEGSWLCAGCIGNGLTTQEVQRRTQDVAHQPQTSPLQEAFTTKQGRDRAQAAQLLHGRVARQPGTSRWGVVRFKGQQCHPHYFAVDWADGTITDKVSPTVLRNSRWLQPEGTVLPSLTLAPPAPGQRRSARLGHGENVGLAVACACPDSHGMALWA